MRPPAQPLALVTGASGGIGRAIAWRLHQDGYAVVAQYRSRAGEVEHLSERITQAGGQCWSVRADLITVEGIEKTAASVRDVLASSNALALTACVNNAGKVLGPSLGTVAPAVFDAYFAVNVRAPLLLVQDLTEDFAPGGAIVNVSSVAAHFSSPGDIVYAMSKAALEAFTRHAAEALARRGIRINTVVPGFTDNGHPLFQEPSVLNRLSEVAVLGGVAQPDSVAASIAFLLSRDASRITGATLDISGGSALGVRRGGAHGASLRDLARG